MRLTKLRLENFRIHRESMLVFGDSPLVVFLGRNWSGKSTIGQALSLCLTPSTAGLEADGGGFVAKIRKGESKAVIVADFQTKYHLIERTVTLSTNTTGRTRSTVSLTDPSWNPLPFDRKLDEQRAALTVTLNTDAFLTMDEKKQKNLLASLALPSRYDFPPLTVAEVETVLGQGKINFNGDPLEAINRAYKGLFDERQIVNRQVREFLIPEPLPMPEGGWDSQAMQERLATLRFERRNKQAERDAAVEGATEEEIKKERIRLKREALLPEDKLGYLREVAQRKPELQALTRQRKKFDAEIEGINKQLAKLEKMPELDAECPTCHQTINPARVQGLITHMNDALKVARDQQFALQTKIKAMGDVDDAVKQVTAHETALKELEEAENPIQPTLFDFSPYDTSLAEYDAEIETLSNQLRPVIAAEERQKEIVIRQQQLADLKDKAKTLDALVKIFDKDGIKAKLLGDYIGGFESKLNEVMSAWGYACALSIEPYSFEVTTARGHVIPVRELSGAERVMFALAFQCAVARTANIGMVVIDEIAMFLPELRPVLYTRLEEMVQQGYLEQVILLVADSSEEAPPIKGASFFMVDDGTVYPMPIMERKETESDRRNVERRIVA